MALDESVFADLYNSPQGGMPAQQQQQPVIPYMSTGVDPQVTQMLQQEQQQPNPMQVIKNHPVAQAFAAWKGSSKEKREQGLEKMNQQMGPPENFFDGEDPSLTAVEIWMRDQEAMKAKKAKDEGKTLPPKKPENRWGKVMKFLDDNPQFMLELGAKLLAPRKAGTSQMSHIASGLNSSLAALQQRKAATRKAELEGKKMQAQTGQLEAQTKGQPLIDDLRRAQAEALRAKMKGGKEPAANVQLLNSITAALWKTGGPKGTGDFISEAEAMLAAQRYITGKASPEEQAGYDQLVASTETISVTPGQAAAGAKVIADEFSPSGRRKASEERTKAQKMQLNDLSKFVNSFGRDPQKIANELAQNPKHAGRSPAELLGMADQALRDTQDIKIETPKETPVVKPRSLAEDMEFEDKARADRKAAVKEKVAVKKQLSKWKTAVKKTTTSGIGEMGSAEGKKIIAQITKEYPDYDDKEATEARALIRLINNKFNLK